MTPQDMEQRIVRYGDLRPCRTAFIDAHTPGSDQKENFTIIGGGVSESEDQHVHIRETPGFNIGAAGQPPSCKNSLHSHTTAEVFFVLRGRWRFYWGLHGDAGEVILDEGDLFNIPTGVFRGFENVGTDYGMIMAILGGDDAGGGVDWAPHVIESAKMHGLILAETGRLYDTKKGERLPDGVQPMPLLTAEQLSRYPETPVDAVVPDRVARYWDMMALSCHKPCDVISPTGLIKDRPGFAVDFVSRSSLGDAPCHSDRHTIVMVMRGHWSLTWAGGRVVLNPGDVCAVPPQLAHELRPAMSGEAGLFRVHSTDDPAGATGF